MMAVVLLVVVFSSVAVAAVVAEAAFIIAEAFPVAIVFAFVFAFYLSLLLVENDVLEHVLLSSNRLNHHAGKIFLLLNLQSL